MTLCVICSPTVKRGLSDSITCTLCNNIFYLNCIPLTQSDADYLKCIKKTWSFKNCLNEGAMPSNSKSVLSVPSPTDSNNIELILRKN
ncbi:PHD-type domain-containing protein [Aphis craccivora]|uniref:PHD-type domain-containing protein n=1 Tax=Aphis craccivora TaxID=307492 RepID=A0A6G0Y481_APHCR|nr:PHD-type domain-containing protein [Aphis craccivora]